MQKTGINFLTVVVFFDSERVSIFLQTILSDWKEHHFCYSNYILNEKKGIIFFTVTIFFMQKTGINFLTVVALSKPKNGILRLEKGIIFFTVTILSDWKKHHFFYSNHTLFAKNGYRFFYSNRILYFKRNRIIFLTLTTFSGVSIFLQ